ncbi:MAG TPA: hypothetical protein DCS12_07585 [Clostridiales bacterium]|nr:hypothetical protein [Clostridiales bacterium]
MDETCCAYEHIGDSLLYLAQKTDKEMVLVAPFIKQNIIERIFAVLKPNISFTCVTRWRLDEICAGVSDINVYDIIKARGGRLLLMQNLHAKYYRGDNFVATGSGNLTAHALGWCNYPNLELMVFLPSEMGFIRFEKHILDQSIFVTDEIFKEFNDLLKNFQQENKYILNNELRMISQADEQDDANRIWLPKSRYPDALYPVYNGNLGELSSHALKSAIRDLDYFNLPKGLAENEFRNHMTFMLLQEPLIQFIDELIIKEYRFGQMVAYIEGFIHDPYCDVKSLWQILIRWLLYFFPQKYILKTYNYSEILIKSNADNKIILL